MKSEWRTVALGSVADLTVGFVGTMASNYTETGIPFLRSTNIEPFDIKFDDIKYISSNFNESLRKSELHPNDVVIVRTGTPGACAVIPAGVKAWNCSDLVIVRPHRNKLNPLFLASYVNLASGVINTQLVGAVQQHYNVGAAKKMQIPLPPIGEQDKIASIIGMLNKKITINSKINDNLQQQASAIYQAWFEEFLLSGGSCPSTWKHGILADIANVTSGKRPSVKFFEMTENAVIPIVGAASIMGYTSESNHTDKILVTGRVGTHGVIQRFSSPCWTSDNTLVITSDLYEYTYQLLKRIDYHSMNRGSTQPLITQSDMNKVPILIPDSETLNNFELLAGKLMEQYQSNLLESRKLAELRDTLLPKLISGEIDVSNIQL